MDISAIKQRFGIIGNSKLLERAIDIARQVAPTDITVLITGESGTGKESFPKIIHQLSARKHGPYIAVNCGAIPEGTIDSELFGHEKGSFTGAHEARKGYFEVVNGGTIFLDEVAELPLLTQVRLLRVLESGEFLKVGSSAVQKTDVRVVAATNVNLTEAIHRGKFREDLYYRLNTVPIIIPALRERKEDIILLFKKFASDFAEKYRMPMLQLNYEAQQMLINYHWSGNVRQLKNMVEQISVIEQNRSIDAEILARYIPAHKENQLPVLAKDIRAESDFSERELLYTLLFDMRKEIAELRKETNVIKQVAYGVRPKVDVEQTYWDQEPTHPETIYHETSAMKVMPKQSDIEINTTVKPHEHVIESFEEETDFIDESLSLEKKEMELLKKALDKHKGRRKKAAKELGISERTLYRKIKEYNLDERNLTDE
ncbi:MAG: sigma-54-dependent Fis family transcriptional regulator [Bacteroidales bacterium]|nr:sigma-54-dependent Fis family transcriptional regulator [Bacteroidales bacterium]